MSRLLTLGWMSDAYGTLKWKHFRRFEVVIGLVELYRISSRRVCVAFFNVPPGNKEAMTPNPLTKEESHQVYNCDDERLSGQLNAGFSKIYEIFKVCGIESLKYIREFYTPVCYCGDIFAARNITLNETNCDWLFDMLVKQPHGRALANESAKDSKPSATSLKIWLYETTGVAHGRSWNFLTFQARMHASANQIALCKYTVLASCIYATPEKYCDLLLLLWW